MTIVLHVSNTNMLAASFPHKYIHTCINTTGNQDTNILTN